MPILISIAISVVLSCKTETSADKMKNMVKLYLDSTLKDPKSYEPISFYIDTIRNRSNLNDKTIYGFMVTHKFRAKNGFGALDLNDMEFRIDTSITQVEFAQPAKYRYRNK